MKFQVPFEIDVLSVLGFIFLSMIATQLCSDIVYFTHLGMRNAWWGIVGTFIGVGIHYLVKYYKSKQD